MNWYTVKTGLLLAALTALIMLIGDWLGGSQGLVIAFVFAVVMNVGAYWYSDKLVLRMYKAQEVSEAQAPSLFGTVRRLTQRAGLPMPKLYIIPQPTPNAFATGRNPQNAAVAVTEGLVGLMGQEELEGVIAHELAHIRNRDILISTIAATLAGVIMMVARWLQFSLFFFGGAAGDDDSPGGAIGLIVLAILAPIAALLIQMAISRSREFQADATGARIAGSPAGLARALAKLDDASRRVPLEGGNPATSHLFIVNPLKGKSMLRFFSTHPPVEERIRRLRALAAG
ncbi:MAG: zinc metalloprotease HtpX [Nitrospinota bacterium]